MTKVVVTEGPQDLLTLSAARQQQSLMRLLDKSESEQRSAGYFHTLREILQQPETWRVTGNSMLASTPALLRIVDQVQNVVLTGSGSSEYACECLCLPLQKSLAAGVSAIDGGMLLTHGCAPISPARPALMISFGRSGDSPESVGALSHVLRLDSQIRHLAVTCNPSGRLATMYRDNDKVTTIVLDEKTNDRSLVMTSSFTNMVLAASFLGYLNDPQRYSQLIEHLSAAAEKLLRTKLDALSGLAARPFKRAIFLASGARIGAARESALKMVEMTAGNVAATCETFLGLRHGPMSAVHSDTLIICYVSSDPLVRAYEFDLIREVVGKRLGMCKLICGEDIPPDLVRDGDVKIELEGLADIGDDHMAAIDVIIGQLLAFFRCLKDGLHPDSPSSNGVINRVVQEFNLHQLTS